MTGLTNTILQLPVNSPLTIYKPFVFLIKAHVKKIKDRYGQHHLKII